MKTRKRRSPPRHTTKKSVDNDDDEYDPFMDLPPVPVTLFSHRLSLGFCNSGTNMGWSKIVMKVLGMLFTILLAVKLEHTKRRGAVFQDAYSGEEDDLQQSTKAVFDSPTVENTSTLSPDEGFGGRDAFFDKMKIKIETRNYHLVPPVEPPATKPLVIEKCTAAPVSEFDKLFGQGINASPAPKVCHQEVQQQTLPQHQVSASLHPSQQKREVTRNNHSCSNHHNNQLCTEQHQQEESLQFSFTFKPTKSNEVDAKSFDWEVSADLKEQLQRCAASGQAVCNVKPTQPEPQQCSAGPKQCGSHQPIFQQQEEDQQQCGARQQQCGAREQQCGARQQQCGAQQQQCGARQQQCGAQQKQCGARQQQCSAPPQQQCSAPPQQQCSSPPQQQCSAPSQQQCSAPPQQQCSAPPQQQCSAPPQQRLVTRSQQRGTNNNSNSIVQNVLSFRQQQEESIQRLGAEELSATCKGTNCQVVGTGVILS